MNCIHLRQTLPQAFAHNDTITSDVWHKELLFQRGQHYLIEAASGTGKSSLCSYLYGYRDDYQGIITFDDRNIRSLSSKEWTELRCTSLSILFQELRIFPELTVLENIRLKNRLTGYKSKKEILSLLDALGIAEKADTKAGLLSYGQQQRMAFIRCLCQPFDFLFLDEPISHLDDGNGECLSRILLDECQARGAAFIVTSVGRHFNDMTYDQILRL
ncbi:MAG: ATP-binding cassette domain-containing protein [Bacteroides sp.]|nr:ATP-binding cassette domain-containing protein [Bacteroides sp.]